MGGPEQLCLRAPKSLIWHWAQLGSYGTVQVLQVFRFKIELYSSTLQLGRKSLDCTNSSHFPHPCYWVISRRTCLKFPPKRNSWCWYDMSSFLPDAPGPICLHSVLWDPVLPRWVRSAQSCERSGWCGEAAECSWQASVKNKPQFASIRFTTGTNWTPQKKGEEVKALEDILPVTTHLRVSSMLPYGLMQRQLLINRATKSQ